MYKGYINPNEEFPDTLYLSLTGYSEGMADRKSCSNPWKLLAMRNVNLPDPLALFSPNDLSSHICVKSDAKATCRVQ